MRLVMATAFLSCLTIASAQAGLHRMVCSTMDVEYKDGSGKLFTSYRSGQKYRSDVLDTKREGRNVVVTARSDKGLKSEAIFNEDAGRGSISITQNGKTVEGTVDCAMDR